MCHCRMSYYQKSNRFAIAMSYTNQEKINMIKWYYQGNSYQRVSDMFAAHFPNRPIPGKSTVQRTVTKFETKGTVINNCSCETRENQREDVRNYGDLDVLLHVEENKGNISTRQLEDISGKDHTTAFRILKRHKYFSYKYEKHQELRDGDEIRRQEFCFNVMERANMDREFLKNICFTDECTFTLNNEPNVQNCRYWSQENQNRFVETRTQYPQKVNVWAGIFGQRIIGPFFLNRNLNAEYFLELLEDQILPTLNDVARENQEVWFQMDGCPAHNTAVVREYLNTALNSNVIGPNHTISWPARSPDLSPNDYFLWGHLKSMLYKGKKYENLDELRNAISAECNRISMYQLANVRKEFYDRLGYCLAVNGGIFEHLIKS